MNIFDSPRHVLVLAAENGLLPDAKAGGMADVVADTALRVASAGLAVTVAIPACGRWRSAPRPSGGLAAAVSFPFRDRVHRADLVEVFGRRRHPRLRCVVVDHPSLAAGTGIYHDDPPATPFATDATRFAAFCSAAAWAAEAGALGGLGVVHAHDWHAGLLFALRLLDPRLPRLRAARVVYTIHNVALQGVRPFRAGSRDRAPDSSFEAWFPWLRDRYRPAELSNPRWPDCVCPAAVAVRHADAVHVVSRAYADEIICPSDPARNFVGGEGLEGDLAVAADGGRLFGIRNGIEYEPRPTPARLGRSYRDALTALAAEVRRWDQPAEEHRLALDRLAALTTCPRPVPFFTVASRLTPQKVGLLLARGTRDPRPALLRVVEALGPGAAVIVAGRGDHSIERGLLALARSEHRLIPLHGFTECAAELLYRVGDWFVVPSTYEPCGLAHLLALRAGQPVIGHAIGGLRETVINDTNGILFAGGSEAEQADGLVDACSRACVVSQDHPSCWEAFSVAARACAFTWDAPISMYMHHLYGFTADTFVTPSRGQN